MRPRRYRRLRAVLDRRQPDLTVLMEKVNKSHNFSAILRSCDAVGVLEAHAVPPEGGLELHRTTSAGSHKWVRVHRHASVREAVDALHRQGLRVLAADPSEDARDYREVDFTRPTAIMVGAELEGVSPEGLGLADERIVIPMVGMVQSLNVSVATAILLFEAFRQRAAAGLYDAPRIPPEEYDRILFEWGYPRLARRFREEALPYPSLGPEGELLEPLPEVVRSSPSRPSR